MKTLFVIPSRLDSTRLPQKPLALIHGKPMVAHVFERVKAAGIGDVIVATCSESIQSLIHSLGGVCELTDPNHASGTDRVYEVVSRQKTQPDFVVNVQGDIPFVCPDDLRSVHALLNNSDVDVSTLCAPLYDHAKIQNPNVVKIAGTRSQHTLTCHYFSRSPIPYGATEYYEHVGIYGYKRALLEQFVKAPQNQLELSERLEQLRLLDFIPHPMKSYITDKAPISVDTPDDLRDAQNVAEKR